MHVEVTENALRISNNSNTAIRVFGANDKVLATYCLSCCKDCPVVEPKKSFELKFEDVFGGAQHDDCVDFFWWNLESQEDDTFEPKQQKICLKTGMRQSL